MSNEDQISEQESLRLIASMIQKAKASYHDTGIGPILWGTIIPIASVVTYFEMVGKLHLGFDIWLLVLAAIIPQVIISIRERRSKAVKKFEDDAINAVWLVFGISIFGLLAYRMIIPAASEKLISAEGWQLMKHYTTESKPDEAIAVFVPSFYSLYILLYSMPTLITGIAKKFWPMIIGAIISYVLFVVSCFTAGTYDMLLGAVSAIFCWLIPGIVIRRRYLAQKKANV